MCNTVGGREAVFFEVALPGLVSCGSVRADVQQPANYHVLGGSQRAEKTTSVLYALHGRCAVISGQIAVGQK